MVYMAYSISNHLSLQSLHPSCTQHFLHILHPEDFALIIPSASNLFFQTSK